MSDYTLRVQKAVDSDEWIEVGLKKIDEPTWLAAQMLIQNGKELDAVRMIINTLCVEGNAKEITGDFDATRAALRPMLEYLKPPAAELKKN